MESSNPDLDYVLLDERIKRKRIAITNADNIDEICTNNGGIERGRWKRF